MVPIGRLLQAPGGQAREHFEAVALQALAESVKRSGFRSPVLVTADPTVPGHFRLVAGERRWRAAQLAGLDEIPCIVELTDPKHRLLARAEENLLRDDLNAVEEATVLVQLMEAFGVGAAEAGALIGRNYQQARRLIQLYEAPQPIRDAVVQGHVDGRAALELVRIYNRLAQRDLPDARQRALADLDELIDRVVNERWSIRRLEKYARELEGGRAGRRRDRGSAAARDHGNAASGARGSVGGPTVPADGPPYRRERAELVLDVDRIERRDVSPEEREELINLLEHLLSEVRGGGRAVRAPVLHVESARNGAKPL
jgi:ParB/RepB/Spo0J family partition protein